MWYSRLKIPLPQPHARHTAGCLGTMRLLRKPAMSKLRMVVEERSTTSIKHISIVLFCCKPLVQTGSDRARDMIDSDRITQGEIRW